jgi:3',5'-nucleoside bisphosphate phosphatase
MEYVDLHIHTIFSDGTDDPKSLVRASRMKGLDVIAITDHDILSGYFEAREEAKRWGVKLISGVEITTPNFHILGLNVNPYDAKFQDFLATSREVQKIICGERIQILQANGVPMTMGKLEGAFPRARLGKYNILMAMMRDPESVRYLNGLFPEKAPGDLLAHYLGRGGLASEVDTEPTVSSEEAIERIHEAGGLAVIAHPFKEVKLIEELDPLVEAGLDGIEVQPNYGDSNIPFREYAEQKGLLITYGSDYHGPSFNRFLLGKGENKFEDLEKIIRLQKSEKAILK